MKYAERDADELVRVLQRTECQFNEVTPLIGEQATSVAMQDTIVEMMCRHTTGNDLLLVSFCGHAVRVSPQRGADDLFLVTHDFHESRAQRNPNRFLSMRWLYEHLHQTSDAINIVLLLDCCYAGNITSASPDPLVIDVRELIKNYDSDTGITNQPHHDHLRVILTATSYNQPALEEHGQGMLTRHVLAALRGEVEEARDTMGNVTLQRLHGYLQQHMNNQSPYLIGSLTRPCILAYYPGLSAEALRERAAAARQQQQAADRLGLLGTWAVDHSNFMKDRLESFVGRVDEFAEIHQRIAAQQPSGGYVTITGQAGQGKSSIIAKLVDAYGPDTVAHHFIPFNPGPDHQVSLLRNIMARLILKYDLLDIFVASESRAALRDFFPRVLRELAAKGGQEVIFIDGLDQIESELTGERDLSFLPTDPPAGVVFVLGTRPDDTLKPLELLKPRYEYCLPNLSRDDFDLVLAHRGVTLAPGLADRFYNAMQRNALYLDLVAKELREAGAADPETMITQLADNPANLFSLSMHRLKRNATQWRTVIKPLLGVLLTSRQPLSQRSLRAIIGTIDADDLRDGLRCLGGLLARDGNDHVYLFHLKLYDFLRENEAQPNKEHIFATDEEQSYHARLADWCAGGSHGLAPAMGTQEHTTARSLSGLCGFAPLREIPSETGIATIWDDHKQNAAEHERRTYARQHYITHLYEARDWEGLFAVLDDGAYGKAKVQDPSTRSYALDLDLGRKAAAWEGCAFNEGIDNLSRLWKYSLLHFTLASHTNSDTKEEKEELDTMLASRADSYPEEVFEAMVLVGWEQRAINTAELLNSREKKTRVLYKIGTSLSNSKRGIYTQKLHELLLQARDDAQKIGDTHSEFEALLCIGLLSSSQEECEILLEAAEIAQKQDNISRFVSLLYVAAALARKGYIDEAREISKRVESVSQRAWFQLRLEIILAQDDYLSSVEPSPLNKPIEVWHKLEVLQALDNVTNKLENDVSSKEFVAVAQAKAGRFDVARAIAEEINDTAKVRVLQEIATTLALTENPQSSAVFKEALTFAQAIEFESELDLSFALSRIAKAQVLTRDSQSSTTIKDALRKAMSIGDDLLRAMALKDVAIVLLLEGNTKEFTDIAEKILSTAKNDISNWTWMIVWEFVIDLIQMEKLEEAQFVARNIDDASEKTRALSQISIAHAKIEERPLATELLEEALNIKFLQEHIIQARKQEQEQVQALRHIATTLKQVGKLEEALTIIQSIGNKFEKTIALLDVAIALTHAKNTQVAGIFDQAEATAKEINDEETKSAALYEVVKALIQVEKLPEAQDIAQSIDDKYLQIKALLDIAVVLAKAGNALADDIFDKAENTAKQIDEKPKQTRALLDIAVVLAKAGNALADDIFDKAENTAKQIDDNKTQSQLLSDIDKARKQGDKSEEVLTDTMASPAKSINPESILRDVQQKWLRATTHSEIIELLNMALPLVQHTPALGVALAEGFAWVDSKG